MSDITFPDRYFVAAKFFDGRFGDLETTAEIDDMKKLAFYALRQQAEKGANNEPAPYMWNVKERYKHSAWSQLGNMNKFEAMVKFVQLMEEMVGAQWIESATSSSSEGLSPEGAQPATDVATASSSNEFAPLTDAVTAENVAALSEEVLRLRKEVVALRHAVSSGPAPPVPGEEEPTTDATASTSSGAPPDASARAKAAAEVLMGGVTLGGRQVERSAIVIPPVRLPSPNSNGTPPLPPQVPPPQAEAQETNTIKERRRLQERQQLPEDAVYYAERRPIGWMEWFGFGSGPSREEEEEVAAKTAQVTNQQQQPSPPQSPSVVPPPSQPPKRSMQDAI